MNKDIPPLSPEVKNSFLDEEMIPEEEVEEIIDEMEVRYSDDSSDSMSVNENDSDNQIEGASQEDAMCVFSGHSSSKRSSIRINY